MNEFRLYNYFTNQISEEEFLDESISCQNINSESYEITKNDLIKLCDLVLTDKIKPEKLEQYSTVLIFSENLIWDNQEKNGEIIAKTIYDWDNPEINHPLTKGNTNLWKNYLLTGKYELDNSIIKISVCPESDGHRDLQVIFPNMKMNEKFDTYYFHLEGEGNNTCYKQLIIKLLESWKEAIQSLNNSRPIYLPIDFSDEYVGCFKVLKNENFLTLTYGYLDAPGYGTFPSHPTELIHSPKPFSSNNDYPSTKVSATEFVQSINENIKLNKS